MVQKNKTIKTLYISYDGMTDSLGQSQVIPYLIGLSEKNVEIHIISAEKPNAYHKNKDSINNLLNEHKINWHPLKYTKRPPVISTIIDIIKIKKLAKKLHKAHNFDIIHCRSYISAFAGLYLKKHYGCKFLFDMRGFYADERVDGNLWPQNNPIFKLVYKYFKRQEKNFFKQADYLVSLTHEGEKIIKRDFGFSNLNTEVIPCCANLEHFDYMNIDKSKKEEYSSKLNLKNEDFVLIYLGSLGTWYLPEEMIRFFSILKKNIPNSKFLVITRDNPQIIFEHLPKYNLNKNDIIVKPAQYSEVPIYISLANLAIFFIKPAFSKKASSPTKLAELLGMGLPIICNGNVGDLDKFFSENKLGYLINNFTEQEYTKAITEIDQIMKIPKKSLREVANRLFSLDIGVTKYYSIYNRLCSQ